MGFSIRQATEKDFSLIQAMNTALFVSDAPHDDALNVDWPQSTEGIAYYRQKLTEPSSVVFIAEDISGRPVGYIIGCSVNKFRYRKVKTGELENMYVAPQWRRQGVGKALIDRLQGWMKTRGIDRMYVSAYAKNEDAIHFYDRCGFDLWEIGLEMKLS